MLKNYSEILRMIRSLRSDGYLDCLLACTFGNFLAPVLVVAHTVNNLDLDNEGYEGYDSD